MWKKLKRWSAMLLAAFLVIGSVEYTGFVAEAEGTTTLTYDSGSTMTSVKEGTDGVEFSFGANNQELKFTLGQTIDASKIMSAKFDITGLTDGQKLALKLYDGSGNQLGVKYNLSDSFIMTSSDITGDGAVSAIGIMANMDGATGSAVFGGVDFVAKTGEADVTKTYKALDGVVTLAENYKYGGVSYTSTDDGKLLITSESAGQQLQMKPASSLNIDDYKSITYNVSELTGSYTFALNSWNGAYFTSQAQTAAGALTFDISGNSGELNLFVFDNQDGAGSMTVDSIVLTKNDDTTVTVTMPQVGYTIGNNAGTTSISNGALTTTLASGYSSTFLTMPAAISSSDWDKVTVNVSAVSAKAFIRPVNADTTWGNTGVCADMMPDAPGAFVADLSTATGSIEQFRVMSTEADVTITIDSIVLSKTPSATTSFTTFAEIPADTSGEGGNGGDDGGNSGDNGAADDRVVAGDILSGFNSSFENSYWWNDANWGSSGIAYTAYAEDETKPSATCGSQYLKVAATADAGGTAMICSADISALFTEGSTYEFSYQVKLDAGVESGAVDFSLFSQTSSYSGDMNPTFTYDKDSYTLSNSEWTMVSGTFVMCDPQDQMWVKFTSAAGVSFLVDELRIGEVADDGNDGSGGDDGAADDRVVAGDILSGFNSSFENSYWWNDANWGSSGIAYTAYAEDETKPSATCGSQYLKVAATADAGGTAMICSADISALFTEGSTYEFSYLVKLDAGVESGAVNFSLYSQTASYSGDMNPTFTYDKDSYTLSNSEWTMVSGTFVMCDPQDQMWVKFTSAAGVSFLVDELRIGEVADDGNGDGGDNGDNSGEGGTTTGGRVVAGDMLSNLNSNFENSYWWNNASWGSDGLTYTAYAADETKPSATCGSQYLKVAATADAGGTAMICNADLSALFTEGSTYEFSYLVKLDAGVESGAVNFSLYSQTASYSGDMNPTFTYDKDSYTLSNSEWTMVSGTFVMCDPQDQMWVKFTSAAGVSFLVDDLRIGLLEETPGGGEGDAPAGEAVKYTFNDLEEYAGWSNTVTIDSNGKFSADFTGAYSQRYYKIPADIDMTKVQKVVFDGFTGSNYELRLLTQADVDGGYASTTVAVSSGNTLNVGANTDVKYVGFCCKSASADAPVTMTADSISFVLYPEGEEAPTTSTLVYNFVDIPISTYTDATYEVDDHGRVAFTCGGQYSYLAFTLPEEIADKKVTHMKLYFVDDPAYENTFNVCIYESTGTNPGMGSNGEQTSWGHNPANVIAVNADMKMVALKAPSAGMKAVLRKVEFTVEGTVTGGSDFISDMEYHFNPDKGGLEKKDGWQSVSSYLSSGRMTFNSSEQYGETRFVYPTELSEAVLKNVVLEISIGSVENLTIKLYTATDETGDGIINGLKPVQMVTGQSSFAVTATEPIAAIGFMNNAAADMDITIDKVTFTIDGDAEGGSTFEKVVNETIPVAAINPVLDAGVTVKDADATGNVVVNFVEQAKTAYFQIPTSVDMSKIKYFILDNLSSDFNLLATGVGTPLNGVQLAGYTAADFASGTPTITSDTSALFTNGRTDLKYFGLRSTAPTAGVSFDSIVFVQKNLTEAGDYKTWKADAFNGLAHANSTAGIVFDGVDKMTFTFNNPEDEAILRLPEGLNLANVDAFTFTFSANDTELNLNLYDADLNLVCGSGNKPYKKGNYWTIDRNMMGKASSTPILYIGVSAATDNPAGATCIFDGVSVDEFITPVYDGNFVVPEYTTITYTWKDMMKYEGDGWSGATWESTEDGLMINFGKGYGEVAMKLPAIIDLAQCETISVKMNGQTVPVAVKIKKNGDTYITNYDKIYGTRTFAPYTDAQVNKLSLMCLAEFEGANAKFESITFVMHGKYEPTVLGGDGIVINGDFMDPDVSDWKEACWDTATITAETSATPIYDNVTTYGNYANRTSPYQGFAQDLTGRVEQNETYKFSFWAKLSDDYKGAPDVQRVISFSPYTVDKDGVADYNPNLQGTYAQVCEVGEWTYYEGTWKVTNANEIGSVYIRIIEQGTNYGQGDCVLGDYAVTGVNIEVYVPEPPSIDEDVPNLKDELTADFGDDFIVGTAIAGNEFDDIGVEMLANKHFNAITLGNELKPDALMGYSETHTALTTATINGQTIEVPTLKFSSADAKLDQILEWNADHPEDPIRVRGHVLVWHSQTMEWFFREGYVIGQNADGSENYVTPEVMNLRLEWYIKTVLEHYVGDDSKYKELFYGWDVVNEAVGDGTGRYRTNTVVKTELPSDTRHGSNSSWWAVYQSNEFIIKAFQYANKYAPADVELYYNDYNECDTKKVQGICKLLSDVLAAEGTRIDAMGMQAHYNIFNPGMGTFEKTIRAYCAVVGKVQLTELDLKASGDIGSESGLQSEYEKQAEHYNKIYNVLRKLDAEEGIEIGGVTFWGTIDTYSWLQSKSNVGGASDGTMKQCPLLFDGSYKVKPAYWAWVDYSVIDPDYVQEVYDGSTKPATPVEDDKAEDKDTEASSDSSENIEETTTVTVTVTPDDKKEGGSNVAPIAAGVAAAVVVVGAGVGAVVLKKKKGLPKKDK